jgi:hypothetical protein
MARYVLLVLTLALASCSSATFTQTGDDPREPLSKGCSVAVLSEIPEDHAFDEVGTCTVAGPAGTPLTDRDIEKLRQCACKGGGNAILLPQGRASGRTVSVVWIIIGKIDPE